MFHITISRRVSSSYRLLLILVCAAFIAACSVKSLYNRMDTLIVEYVEGLVSLDDQLEADVNRRASALLDWHRSEQLDDYTELMRALQRDFGPGMTEQQLQQHVETIESLWRQLMRQLDADMAEVLPRLNADQRVELFSSLDGKNKRFREEFVEIDDDERFDNYVDRMTDSYEGWLGDLTDEQEGWIEQAAGQLVTGAQGRLAARMHWQGSIRRILDSDPGMAQKTQQLREFFAGFDANRMPAVEQSYLANKRVFTQLTLRMVQSASAAQRQHFMMETDDFIRSFEELRTLR